MINNPIPDFDLGRDFEVTGATGLDAFLERQPEMVTPTKTVRVASLRQLVGFTRINAETLVHKSERDLWAIKRDGDGMVIQRLFADDGRPLKG